MSKKQSIRTPSQAKRGVLNYVWSHYSFYGIPDPIPRFPPVRDGIRRWEVVSVPCRRPCPVLGRAERLPPMGVCVVRNASERMVTDGGQTLRRVKRKYGLKAGQVGRILGRMHREAEICFWGGELGIRITEEVSEEQACRLLSVMLHRFYLICRVTLKPIESCPSGGGEFGGNG